MINSKECHKPIGHPWVCDTAKVKDRQCLIQTANAPLAPMMQARASERVRSRATAFLPTRTSYRSGRKDATTANRAPSGVKAEAILASFKVAICDIKHSYLASRNIESEGNRSALRFSGSSIFISSTPKAHLVQEGSQSPPQTQCRFRQS